MKSVYEAMLFTEKQFQEMKTLTEHNRSLVYKMKLRTIQRRLAFYYQVINKYRRGSIKIMSKI
jgi:hypothetical protein